MIIFLQRIIKIPESIKYQTLLKIFLTGIFILLCAVILHTIFFRYFEDVSWNESLWQTWQTFTTVGYGNKPAETIGGRWTTILFGTMGIAFLGVIISQAFDLKQDRSERRRLGMMENPIRDGVIIINYPGAVRLQGIIRELRYLNGHMGFCVIDEKLEELPPQIEKLGNIVFIKGEILKEETYRRAALDKNSIVMVFPTQSGVPSSDGITQLIVKNASKFIKKDTRIVYVQVDPENEWLFNGCPGTSVFESFEILAIVQEATDIFSSVMVEELFLNTKGSNPKTVKPKHVLGWSWFEFSKAVIQIGQEKNISINPFGIIKKGEAISCPPFDTIIEEGDFLSIIVYPDFGWERFERYLAENIKMA